MREASPSFPSRGLRILSVSILLLLPQACSRHPPLSPVSAGTLAADLANARCRKTYGKRPFRPDDFEAMLDGGRWHWGTPDGGKVDGFEVEVSFDRRGGEERVMVRIPEE
ncbi:MAG TPA: hypothetical protein VJ385_01420 [Fibrobacteria bacterium]|nr:hypothetical protein [Fibrobacteria bacterium]